MNKKKSRLLVMSRKKQESVLVKERIHHKSNK